MIFAVKVSPSQRRHPRVHLGQPQKVPSKDGEPFRDTGPVVPYRYFW
jgi:hypothetical protein